MKLAILMDPLKKLKHKTDTTLAILKRATQLGWYAVFFTQDTLVTHHDNVYAHTSTIIFKNNHEIQDVISHGETKLSDFDMIFIRQDPPFNLEYIYTTYALELVENTGVLVINKPQSLRDMNEKFSILQFPDCCPPTIVSRNLAELRKFWQIHKQVIYKPLNGMGGKSIFYVDESGQNLSVILEVMANKHSIMAQKYIPAITDTGDKRILILNGKPLPYALARIPAAGELRGNLVAGATGKVMELSVQDQELCHKIAPILYKKGLYFVGIDVIGNYITEINITSPTCVMEIQQVIDIDIIGNYLINLTKL